MTKYLALFRYVVVVRFVIRFHARRVDTYEIEKTTRKRWFSFHLKPPPSPSLFRSIFFLSIFIQKWAFFLQVTRSCLRPDWTHVAQWNEMPLVAAPVFLWSFFLPLITILELASMIYTWDIRKGALKTTTTNHTRMRIKDGKRSQTRRPVYCTVYHSVEGLGFSLKRRKKKVFKKPEF